MPLKITDESYNALPSLYANAGDRVEGQIKFRNSYYAGSGTTNKFSTAHDSIIKQSGTWYDSGFSDGDSVTFYFKKLNGPSPGFKTFTLTISYCNGNTMFFTTSVPAPYQYKTFPESGRFTGMFCSVNKQPKSVDFRFNLSLFNTNSLDSVIDSELNRYINNAIDSLAVAGSASMTQMGNKSGGIIESLTVTRNADTTFPNAGTNGSATEYNYTVDFVFHQWGLFKDDNNVPIWYFAADCLQPISEVSSYPQVNVPNGRLTAKNAAQFANVGWFDENYNGFPAAYTFTDIDLTDSSGNPYTQIAYNQTTSFTATFAAPNQSNGNSNYRIGMAFTPIDEAFFKNLPLSMKNNCMLNVPNVDFQHSATPDATTYTGNARADGSRFDFVNLQFSHAADVLTVTGDIVPSSGCETFFDEIADEGRNIMLWVQIGDYTLTGQLSDQVNVLAYNDDCFSAPRLGVQYPDVVSDTLYDHASLDVTSTTIPNTTTEDNILYVGELTVDDDTVIDKIRVGIQAYNYTTGETFMLEYIDFSTDSVPFISGKYEFNETVNRGFLLPPSTDRNIVSIIRKPSLDGSGYYGLEIRYGFLNDWRYWVEQSNVSDDLFDSSLNFNGKNKNWQRYQNSGDFGLRVAYFIRIEDVDDFNYTPFIDRDYEDDPTVTTAVTITDISGNTLTAIPNSGVVDVETVFTWDQNFTSEWAEITCESFEGSRIGFISSVLDHDGQSPNCFIPIPGETKLKAIASSNLLTCNFKIDCAQISASETSLTFRCFSEPQESIGYLITQRKQVSAAYSIARKLAADNVYNGPLIRVRRSSDDAELDISHINGNLDTATMLSFAAGGDAYVSIIYDQGAGNNATQTNPLYQGKIVDSGTVITAGSRPAIVGDGIDYDLTYPISSSANIYQTFVFKRDPLNTGVFVALGNSSDDVTFGVKAFGDDELYGSLNGSNVTYGTDATLDHALAEILHGGTTTELFINDSSVSSQTDSLSATTFTTLLKANTLTSEGYFQELILTKINVSSVRSLIAQNIIGYYGL